MTDGRYWAWCDECRAWVGSEPPLLPNYWSNSKAAAMHKAGTGHRPDLVTFEQARAIAAKEYAALLERAKQQGWGVPDQD